AEVAALARVKGAKPETFDGLAGAGDLVANVTATGSPQRLAAEAVDSVSLLAGLAREAQLETPALDDLAALVEGRIDPAQWQKAISEPSTHRNRTARAA
ncbi:MAG: hypothetical protein WAL22_05630, partial [Solirubrobacteraceae bacterium]